jgi:A/G-specific adenine glycosylase
VSGDGVGVPGEFAARVIAWQRRHGRHDLPWQHTRDPYRVWLSEVMLQQTQVATVLGYYERFLARFPDVHALAAAPLDDVLALWSGLGYYSRARHLHRCAQVLADAHGGRFPTDSASLASLPGIGRSTAAAIAAFCFGERAAILDGNVKRVLTRALGFGEDLSDTRSERALWRRAEDLLPPSGIDAYTQGLMDLGATLCTTRSPRCEACPLRDVCVARAEGRVQAYPVRTRRLKRGRRQHALLWLQRGSRVWLVQRPAKGVWASLWSLPEFTSADELGSLVAGWPGRGEWLAPIEHALTHFDWQLQPWRHRLPARLRSSDRALIEERLGPGRWVAHEDALASGLPAPIRRLIAGGQRFESRPARPASAPRA